LNPGDLKAVILVWGSKLKVLVVHELVGPKRGQLRFSSHFKRRLENLTKNTARVRVKLKGGKKILLRLERTNGGEEFGPSKPWKKGAETRNYWTPGWELAKKKQQGGGVKKHPKAPTWLTAKNWSDQNRGKICFMKRKHRWKKGRGGLPSRDKRWDNRTRRGTRRTPCKKFENHRNGKGQ